MIFHTCLDNFTDDDMANRTPVFDDWLEQGDLLYIPRGFIHQVRYTEHISFLFSVSLACAALSIFLNLLICIIPSSDV